MFNDIVIGPITIHMYGVMIALASGALMSIQGVFNTDVTKQTSLWVSAAFVQFTALLVCLAAWLLYDRTSFWSLWEIQDKYVLLGGAIGALITATVIRSMNARKNRHLCRILIW